MGKNPRSYIVAAQTDSQLLVGQLTRTWEDEAANQRPLSGSFSENKHILMQTCGIFRLI